MKLEGVLEWTSLEVLSILTTVSWDGGAQTIINNGTNGNWRDVLSLEEIKKYEQIASDQLDADCAQWLATGKMAQ